VNAAALAYRERIAKARSYGDVIIPENIAFEERLANRDGMCFTLLLEDHHTADDVRIAKRYLRRNRDVVEIDILRPP